MYECKEPTVGVVSKMRVHRDHKMSLYYYYYAQYENLMRKYIT